MRLISVTLVTSFNFLECVKIHFQCRDIELFTLGPEGRSGVKGLRWYPGFSTGFLKDDGVEGARFPSDARQRPQLAE